MDQPDRAGREKPPAFVWCATVALAAVMGLWLFLTPVTKAPDEAAHIDLVFHLAAGNPYPAWDGRPTGTETFDLVLTHGVLILHEATGGLRTAETAANSDLTRPYRAEDDEPAQWLGNQMPQHPPLYYQTTAWALRGSRLLPGQRSFAEEVQLVRLGGAVLMSAIPLLTWATARRLRVSKRAAVAAGAVPLLVPQFAHIGASVNNDTFLVPLMALTAFLLAKVPAGDLSASRGLKIGLVAGLAGLTKGFALVLPVWIAVVYLASLRGERQRRWPEALRSLVVAGVAFVSVSGWFWVRNLVVHDKLSPSIQSSFPPLPEYTIERPYFVWEFVRRMSVRFWGEFGYHELPMRIGFFWAFTLAAALAIGAAFARRPRRTPDPQGGLSRVPMAAMLSLAVLLLAFAFIRSWDLYSGTGVIRFVQGRYLFGAIVAIGVTIGVGATRLAGRFVLPALVGLVLIVQAEGMRTALRGWWGRPGDSFLEAFEAIPAWNPRSQVLLWLSIAVLVASTVGLLVLAWRDATRPAAALPSIDT